jgi:lysyl-tRNA synthetase, class I
MIWVDRIIEEIEQRFAKEIKAGTPLIIRDEKTLSGRVHVGSLRGIVIHGLIAQVLKAKGVDCAFKFELNEFDPMDGLPPKYERTHRGHMGKPLFTVPCPNDESHANYPMVFGDELKETVEPMHLPIAWTFLRPLYEEGKFNDFIVRALQNAPQIRAIYKEVSGGDKPNDWYPLQVICEKCGKVGTTQVTAWNEKEVTYSCKPKLVEWAEGCGHEGSINPFDGRAKLPWKVEWAAKWKVYGVHIEGCGKDHSAAGGSRQIAARISEEIFEYPNPFDIPYEFLNIAGKKMSSSKGLGAAAKDIADLLPPHLLKLLMIRTVPNRPIDFDPEGKTIPNLFDEYDRLSDHFFKRNKEPDEDFARTFQLTQLDTTNNPEDLWQMRFTVLSFVLQMPHLDLIEEAEKLKGGAGGSPAQTQAKLTKAEKVSLEERARYVQQWLDKLAPDEYTYQILEKPPTDLKLDDEQKIALAQLSEALADESLSWEGKPIHEKIHEVKEGCGITPKKLFQPIYQIFLGRSSGPQVGWFLSTFERSTVISCLTKAI